jgi:hypothetical protein
LGDDIVIADKAVADSYLQLMKFLGVDINLDKSLVSDKGVAEFAKRLISSTDDLSPLSPKLTLLTAYKAENLVHLVRDLVSRGASVQTVDLIKFIEQIPGRKLSRDFI